jgi:hypothetical protein
MIFQPAVVAAIGHPFSGNLNGRELRDPDRKTDTRYPRAACIYKKRQDVKGLNGYLVS